MFQVFPAIGRLLSAQPYDLPFSKRRDLTGLFLRIQVSCSRGVHEVHEVIRCHDDGFPTAFFFEGLVQVAYVGRGVELVDGFHPRVVFFTGDHDYFSLPRFDDDGHGIVDAGLDGIGQMLPGFTV